MKKLKNLFKGFTLVELIIVIAIVAILSVAAFLVVTKWIGKSRDARRLNDLSTMKKSLVIHKTDLDNNGMVPMPSGEITTGILPFVDGNDVFSYIGKFGLETISELDNMQKVPKDPVGEEYIYGVDRDRLEFEIAVTLEGEGITSFVSDRVVAAGTEKAMVDGNYEPREILLTGNELKMIPSLLFIKGENTVILGEGYNIGNIGVTGVNFIVDEGNILGYSPSGDNSYSKEPTQEKQDYALKKATGNKDASFEGVNLAGNLTGIIEGIRNNSGSESEVRETIQKILDFIKDEESIGGGLSGVKNISEIEEEINSVLDGYKFEQSDSNVNSRNNNLLEGECGGDNGKRLVNEPVNLCNKGTASNVNGAGPWSWDCEGENGGLTVSCSANKMLEVIEGTHVAGETSIMWKWSNPVGISKVEWSTDGNTWIDKGTSMNHEETGLICETNYYSRKVRVCDEKGECTTGIELTSVDTTGCPVKARCDDDGYWCSAGSYGYMTYNPSIVDVDGLENGEDIRLTWNDGNWNNMTTTSATGESQGNGKENTNKITSTDANSSQSGFQEHMAAQFCADLELGGYDDWYLPSKWGLLLLFQYRENIGGFKGSYYWSSTETENGKALRTKFSMEDYNREDYGKSGTEYVRCMRR